MAFETREQVLEKVLSLEKPNCPHCKQEMQIYEVPPIAFSDGLGWGVPFLFVCFNDDCELYKSGWESIRDNYAHSASYRCMNYPDTDTFELMTVFGPMGGTGQTIDDQAVMEQEILKERTKRGFSILADCYNDQDGPGVLSLLTDSSEPVRVRLKAAEMVGDICEVGAVDPLRNLKFGNTKLQEAVEQAIKKIHERHFTRECPFCAEIIKKQAKLCKHCGQEVAGQ